MESRTALRAMPRNSTAVTATAPPTSSAMSSEVTRKIRVSSDSPGRRLAVVVAITLRPEVGLAVFVQMGRNQRTDDLDADLEGRLLRQLDLGRPGVRLLVPNRQLPHSLGQAGKDEIAGRCGRNRVRSVEHENVGDHAVVNVAVDPHQPRLLETLLFARARLVEAEIEL